MSASLLVRNEALKTTRRTAFWVTLLAFAGVASISVGQQLYWDLTHPGATATVTLPGVWARYLPHMGPLPAIFGAVAVVLLVTTEFSWKTARQNVIDGLSKEEFFVGKLFTWIAVMLVFVVAAVVVIGGAGLVGSYHAGTPGPFAHETDVALMGGMLLCALGYSSIAYFSAFLTRSSGAALGLFLLYVAFVENVLGGVLRHAGDMGKTMASYLARTVFDRLTQVAQYDLHARQEIVARAMKKGLAMPHFASTDLLVGAAALWILVFVVLSFWVYERRDL